MLPPRQSRVHMEYVEMVESKTFLLLLTGTLFRSVFSLASPFASFYPGNIGSAFLYVLDAK